RAAAFLRLLEQGLVVLLGGLERIRADDRLARIVLVAVAPRRGRRRVIADQRLAERPSPELLDARRAVAAEVARVAPKLAVLVEILRREEIDRQRLDALRHLAVARRADIPPPILARIRRTEQRLCGTDELGIVDVRGERPGPPDALESDIRQLLRGRRASQQDEQRACPRVTIADLHDSPPPELMLARAGLVGRRPCIE